MGKFEELRNKYKTFIFEDYKIIEGDNDTIKITFYFEIPRYKKFKPTLEISKLNIDFDHISIKTLKNIVFNIGMIELMSYWKTTCSKRIIIECGKLTDEQVEWYKKIYYYGLGEFRYINNIDIDIDDLFEIESECKPGYITEFNITETTLKYSGTLIPVGGGKDSCVTLDLLKDCKKDNLCLVMDEKKPQLKAIKKAGYKNEQIIHIKRTI